MLRIRVKMGPTSRRHNTNNNNGGNLLNSKEWTCCFGLHVHTATIMIGLWHLFLNILALSLLAVIWRNPHMVEELENSYDYNVDLNAPALPTPLSKVEPPYAYHDRPGAYRRPYQTFDMGGLVCTCMIAITLMMIYGTIKGKPSHLLPFFCLQLFDFAITTLTAAGYLCYLQAIHRLIAESHRLPWREKLLEMSPEELVVFVLLVFVCIVVLKAYAIGIVWRCYKYLTLRQQNTLLPCVIPDLATANLVAEERAYNTLLPNYDEAISQYLKQAPPPSYQAAMSNMNNGNSNGGGGGNAAGAVTPGGGVSAAIVNAVRVVPATGMAAGAAAITIEAEAMDNNNDIPNNNNTVHINANTPPMVRNNAMVIADANGVVVIDPHLPGAVVGRNGSGDDDDEDMINTPPPPYNDAILISTANAQQQQQMTTNNREANISQV